MYTTVEDFPPEILSIITASLQSKKDLKSLRLVARAFHDAAVPQLFDSIFIIARYTDLEIASRVAVRFGRFVKKIVLSSECYMPVASVENYLRMAESRSEQMKALCSSKEEFQVHGELYDQFQAYGQLYCQLARDNKEMAWSGLLMSKLCHFIKILPKLRTVVLTDALCRQKEGCWCTKAYSETRERIHSPVDYMALRRRAPGDSVKSHTGIECMTPLSGLGLQENNLWPMLMEAMHATGITTIKEILVETTGQELTTAVFRYTALQAYLVSVVVPNLTRLHLALNVSLSGHDRVDRGLLSWHDGLRRTLSAAINLESLTIGCNTGWRTWPLGIANWYRTSLFGLMLLGCSFPKLTAFSSNDLSISESDILAFLGAHLDLKHLSMRNVTMISGSWRRTIQNLKDGMQLATVDMRGIIGGTEEDVHFRYNWADEEFTKGLQDFFSGHSEDPFTKGTLDRALLKRHRYLPGNAWEDWASKAWNW